jgi:uncharacterized protein (DUF433 family)
MGLVQVADLNSALYSCVEADHLAAVTPGTSKRWLGGYVYRSRGGQVVGQLPVTVYAQSHVEEGPSFLDLVEVKAIGELKEAGFSLGKIREIVANCQQFMDVDRPLVRLKFLTDGRIIFVEHGEDLLEVGRRKGQHAWFDFLAPFLKELDYEHDLARRWYPLGKEKLVVVDPDYGYGFPVVKNSGVRTEIVLERFQVGETIEEIAADFNIQPIEVQQALQFEARLAKRAA